MKYCILAISGEKCLGKVAKGMECSIVGCSNKAEFSLSAGSVGKYLNVDKNVRRVYLCRIHYKEYKKASKRDRELERVRYKTF